MPTDQHGAGGPPPVRLEVRMLGSAEVILDGRRLRAFNSLRLQRFLALVVLRRGAQHRGRLAFEMWPDSEEAQARTNLRKLLHEARRSLPDLETFIDVDHEAVAWRSGGPSQVDVLRFRDAVAAGNHELAARLYGGDLLPACYDTWVLEERSRLRGEANRVLRAMMEQAASAGEHQATIRHAERVLDLEPTDEAAVRLEMDAWLALGDRGAALRAYRHHAEVLERELAVPPGEAIREQYEQLRRAAGSADTRRPRAEPVGGPVAESPFVGRHAEWEQLGEAWAEARDRGVRVVLVTGEPGIGKSRLAAEFGRRVREEGHQVAAARAYEAAGRPPWGPIVDLLRSDPLRRHVDAIGPEWRAELARLAPDLEPEPRSEVRRRSLDATVERRRLLDAVSRVLAAGHRPRLLVLDDLQWCDAETLEALGFLAGAQPAAPVLILGTVRSEEVGAGHPLPALVDLLGRDGLVTTVPLAPLDRTHTVELAAGLRDGDAVPEAMADRLWAETEGNPLFVVEAMRAGIDDEADGAVLTPTMRAVLRARLAQLSPGAGRVAEVAAVIGRPFSMDLLARSMEGGESELVDPIDELWNRRIVRDLGAVYDFSHDKLRAVALELVSPARLRLLHGAVAQALATGPGVAGDEVASRQAAHYDQAGMVEPAIEAYGVAGRRSVTVSALEEAVRCLERALTLLNELPQSPERDARELDLLIALGSPLVAVEGYGSRESHRLYERARALCVALDRPVAPPILRGLGLARLQGCRFDESTEMGRDLVESGSDDPVVRTEGEYLLGVSAFWQGDLQGARHHLTRSLEAFDPSLRDAHLASYAQDPESVCTVRLALVALWSGDPDRARSMAQQALDAAADIEHAMTTAYVLTYAAIGAAEAEDQSRLDRLLTEAAALWPGLSDRYLVVVLDALHGWLEVRGGAPAGIDRIVRSAATSRAEGETLHLSYTLLLLARAHGLLGEHREGRVAAEEAIAWSERTGQRYLEAELCRVAGELAYGAGERDAAESLLRRAVDVATGQGAAWLGLRALDSLSRRLDDVDARRRLTELLAGLPSGHGLPPFQAAAELLDSSPS